MKQSLRYLSVCSGIEAATVAWHPLGFRPLAFSEIDAFARAVLAHHYRDVPIHGDFTALRDQPWIVDADILVGGTPCQAFSVAGLRNSLADERGNLSLEFVRLADAIDALRQSAGLPPAIVVWENVPGVLSVRDNAFGCFISGLAGDAAPYDPPRGKWTNAGVAAGPARTVAWRIMDAQYFGLAQRRRRVFVVASAREGFDPAAVLLEFEGMRRDTPPRREARQDAAADARCSASVSSGRGWWSDSSGLSVTLRAQDSVTKADTLVHGRAGERSHWDGAEHPHPTLNQSFNTGAIGYSNQELFSQRGAGLVGNVTAARMVAFGEYAEDETASTVKSRDYKDATDLVAQCSTGDVAHCLNAGSMGRQDFETETLVTHALRGEGFDASEGGTGRGTPLVPVAFSAKDHGADASVDLSPTLRAMPHDASHANGGGQMAVAIPIHEVGKRTGPSSNDDPRAGIGIGRDGDPMFTLQAGAKHGVAAYAFQPRIARNGRGDMGDVVNALNAQSGETGKGDAAPCVATINHGDYYADAAKAGPIEALRTLRRAVGEEAFTVWGFGVLAAFQPPEILQSALHGCGLRPAAFSRSWLVRCALGCAEHGPAWLLQSLRETGCAGCPPPGWEPSQQLARELGAYLSKLSQPASSAEGVMRDLWLASEGPGVLQQALHSLQETRRPAVHNVSGHQALMAVRRLTATECEFLQGFPRGYTLIPWKKKPAADCPDGPRYKALGNSMAVPCMRWIGGRIAEALK